jgi:hypothetical protein
MPPASSGRAISDRAAGSIVGVMGHHQGMDAVTRIRRLRLAAQHIEGSDFAGPVDVVRWMLAMQGQDLPGTKWSVGLRAPGCTLADVDGALDRGEIIRSWPMRGTLHLVAAEDIGWMLELTAARTLQSLARRHRELGLDQEMVSRAREVAIGLLEGGRSATRSEIFRKFEAAGVPTEGQRGPHLLGRLHHDRLLCLGPMQGNDQVVVLLDEWVPNPRVLERDEALGEFVGRFLASHGPATIRDFCWWTKLPVRDAKIGLALARDRLTEFVVDDTSYWMAPGLPDRAKRDVHLLPGFDEFLLGYQDRSASLAAEHMQAIVPGNNGMFQATVVLDGQVVGTWRRKKTRAGLTITPVPFQEHAGMAGFRAAATNYGRFLTTEVTVINEAAGVRS